MVLIHFTHGHSGTLRPSQPKQTPPTESDYLLSTPELFTIATLCSEVVYFIRDAEQRISMDPELFKSL